MTTATVTPTTLDLTPGTRVAVRPALNAPGIEATVEAVEPWMLTAGPNAGTQARQGRGKNAPLLYTVKLCAITITAPSLRPLAPGSADEAAADSSRRHCAVTADHQWTLA